jgi:hypothetical protein
LLAHDTSLPLDPVIQMVKIQGLTTTAHSPRFWLGCCKYESLNSGVHHRSNTHQTGLERHIKTGINQTIIPDTATCVPQGNNFGVSTGVSRANHHIVTTRYEATVSHYNATDWDFTASIRLLRLQQGLPHPVLVFIHTYSTLFNSQQHQLRSELMVTFRPKPFAHRFKDHITC